MVKRLLSVGIAILMLSVLSGGAAAASGQKPTRDNNCIHPSGVSLNELFDVPEQFVGPICPGLTAAEHWRAITNYFGAETADAVTRPGTCRCTRTRSMTSSSRS